MNIRPATIDDALNLSILFKIAWIETYTTGAIEIPFSEYVAKYFSKESILKLLEIRSVFIIDVDLKLVGGGVINPQTGELEQAYILPVYRSKGFGQALMQYLDNRADLPLWMTCLAKNKRSLNFYEKQGYQPVGEMYFESNGKQQTNVKLAKSSDHKGEVFGNVG